jgi:uncharacterized protein (TIGR03067 family)
VIFIVACINSPPRAAYAQTKTKDVCGRWHVEKLSTAEKDAEIKDVVNDVLVGTLVINADKKAWVEFEGVKLFKWDVEFDMTKKPISVDFTLVTEEGEKLTLKGILKLENDDLTIVLSYDGRPTDFAQKKDSNTLLFKCKKEK